MASWKDAFRKPTNWFVLLFILVVVFFFAKTADGAETSMELAPGTMFVAGHRYNGGWLLVEETWNDKYSLAFGLTTVWNCADSCTRGEGPSNQFVQFQRVINYKKFEMGLGLSYWANETPAWSSHTPFSLHVGWNFTNHFGVNYRHYSTGGASIDNGGFDLLAVDWSF